ncbi:MAG: pyridoxamine 5'-phosphate oxidase family protein [Proteobacteria bacterium]|nr:pyridoxamine 5'-phosphate oxidase family protein [Pseudomonadota bacterium]
MALIQPHEREDLLRDVEAATKQAIWCALATATPEGEPRVRMVHPTWEGPVLWFATGTGTAKVDQIRRQPMVDLQFQVAPPDFVHVLVRGRARIEEDPAEKKRVWDVIDYDLGDFWPGGPTDPNYALVRIDPTRVELSRMFGSQDKRVWRAP